jgi:hypothetical protein
MSKHYDNIEYDDKESNIQNTWKKTYSTEESKQEDYDRNNHSISLSEIKEQETLEEEKDLSYWKANAEEDYMKVPISVLRYISELEERSYSEEDMNNYAEYCTNHVLKSQIGHPYLSVTEWFEQFKKK